MNLINFEGHVFEDLMPDLDSFVRSTFNFDKNIWAAMILFKLSPYIILVLYDTNITLIFIFVEFFLNINIKRIYKKNNCISKH